MQVFPVDLPLSHKSRNQLESEILELRTKVKQSEKCLKEIEDRMHQQTSRTNRMFLNMKRKIKHQEDIITRLREEQDTLTKNVLWDLLLLEARLRKEQKEIQSIIKEKDLIIERQKCELHSIKNEVNLLNKKAKDNTSFADDTHDSGIEMPINETTSKYNKDRNDKLDWEVNQEDDFDVCESETKVNPKVGRLYGSYERITELGIKTAMGCYNRLFNNHRSVTKPKDVKQRRLSRHGSGNCRKAVLERQM